MAAVTSLTLYGLLQCDFVKPPSKGGVCSEHEGSWANSEE